MSGIISGAARESRKKAQFEQDENRLASLLLTHIISPTLSPTEFRAKQEVFKQNAH